MKNQRFTDEDKQYAGNHGISAVAIRADYDQFLFFTPGSERPLSNIFEKEYGIEKQKRSCTSYNDANDF